MRIFRVMLIWLALAATAQAEQFRNPALETQVEALFADKRDLAAIKLDIDRIVAPSIDIAAAASTIDAMAADLQRIGADVQGSFDKLKVLRRYVYEAGAWNGNRPFAYDRDDPLGRKAENRLLADYLTDHRGSCVTMPILFAILGERMGLTMTLAEAPLHVFVKFTDDEGNVWNLETTSGAGFTRDSHYRKQVPMSDEAIESGIYMRALSHEETVAAIAALVVEDLMVEGRFEDAIAVSDVLLKHAPRSVYLVLKRGTAYGELLKRDVVAKYRTTGEMPPEVRARADSLYRENLAAFERAEALGWRIEDGQL
jgi:regulator of sirC expression with transglutaminase-like and TPR domain